MFGAFLEVEMWKRCTSLWGEAHLKVNMFKAPHVLALLEIEWHEAHFDVNMVKSSGVRTNFGSWDIDKVSAVVARSRSSPARTWWSNSLAMSNQSLESHNTSASANPAIRDHACNHSKSIQILTPKPNIRVGVGANDGRRHPSHKRGSLQRRRNALYARKCRVLCDTNLTSVTSTKQQVVMWGCGDVVWCGDVVMRCCDGDVVMVVIEFFLCLIFRIAEFGVLNSLW